MATRAQRNWSTPSTVASDMLGHVNWPAFLIAMAAVELTPGPNMGWLAALSARLGWRAGLMAVAGVTLGLLIQLIAAATGASALLEESPLLYESLRWAGVAFMLYLAWEAFADTGSASAVRGGGKEGFRRGLIANILNPKALLFYIIVVGQFVDPTSGAIWSQIVLLGLIHLTVAILVHVGIVFLGASLGAALERWRTSLLARIGFALTLAAIAVWIGVSTHR
ncbi:lysine exporter protein LysE/YggA [Hyphomonas oceanitis SCH89]|uniref:Lysine exporter protein LysE/YggA n=2 Tax=Hyphomonas oceanitis TaxID=81033 RepID=A0A059G6B5_9PROT|nr:lysine exporter protein LysE/YggA [Hyphomonas oceanitis SCH89]